MIGILGAYALNNWNENRKEKKVEYKALVNLRAEFRKNKDEFERQKNILISVHEGLVNYLQELKRGEIEITSFLSTRILFMTYDPVSGTVNSLISTGNIDLIRDDSLKYLLTSWQSELEDFKEEGEWNRLFIKNHFMPYIRGHFPYIGFLVGDSTDYNFLTGDIREKYITEIKNPFFQNLMVGATDAAFYQIYGMPKFEKYLDQINYLIDKNLKEF